jgi:hypothetical protein
MNLEEAKAEIRDVIHHAAEGSFSLEERRRIDAALPSLRTHARVYELHHIRELEDWLATFESPQKSRRFTGEYGQVRVWILGCLDKIGWHESAE